MSGSPVTKGGQVSIFEEGGTLACQSLPGGRCVAVYKWREADPDSILQTYTLECLRLRND